jgi:oligosaccharide translocation protein RFT1
MFQKPDETLVTNYDYAIVFCCLACVIELVGEPANSILQMLFLAKSKVLIEASSLFIFNITFVFLALFFPSTGALAYSIARVLNSSLFVLSNFFILIRNQAKQKDLKLDLKSLVPNQNGFDRDYLNLVKAYYAQSVFKQILTEGERYLITVFNLLTFSESGIYDLVNNLGSLIARFVFLPIEDASYVFFTNSIERGDKYRSKDLKAKSYFELLLKMVSLIGLLVFVFGQSYSQMLLQIYGGDKLGKNEMCVNMLRFHCFYLYLLALNGITESFFNATMSESQLNKHNYKLIIFSLFFLAFSFAFAKTFHIYGFLLANCINMCIRIYYSSLHIRKFFKGYRYNQEVTSQNDLISDKQSYDVHRGFLPNLILGSALCLSLIITKTTENLFNSYQVVHFGIGALLFFIDLFIIYKQETYLVSNMLKFFKNSKAKA